MQTKQITDKATTKQQKKSTWQKCIHAERTDECCVICKSGWQFYRLLQVHYSVQYNLTFWILHPFINPIFKRRDRLNVLPFKCSSFLLFFFSYMCKSFLCIYVLNRSNFSAFLYTLRYISDYIVRLTSKRDRKDMR